MASPTQPADLDAEGPRGLGLGTFLGVFTPTILTILGVMLYLRLGWVTGHGGLLGAFLVIALANSITAITALSLSALSTNMRVGVGGAYFIISRSMGLELGGALGIPLYLSQTLSVTLYAFGLIEATFAILGLDADAPGWLVQLGAGLIVVGVTALAARSTVLALKAQLPIMGLIALSLVGLYAGADWGGPLKVATLGPFEQEPFWTVFAVFFPAVTGVMAGVSLSGDLTDPGRSIPRGVLSAVVVGFLIYMITPIALGLTVDAATLQGDKLIWGRVARGGLWVVVPGLIGAVLSSAIGSILSAPRTLQALALDGLVPRRLAQEDPKTGEPLLPLYISGAVALGAVALGDLNAVAEVVTMFFLTTYGMLNLAAALESWIRDPSYRPRIRVPAGVSLLGAVGCFLTMALINPLAFVLAVLIEVALWWWLRRRNLEATWGDLRSGLWFALARLAIMQLRTARVEARNWRPHLLVFTGDIDRDVDVVGLAVHLGQDRGIVTVVTLLEGRLDAHTQREATLQHTRAVLDAAGLLAFPEVHMVPRLDSGLLVAAQANGLAGLDSNTVVFRWPEAPDSQARVLTWVAHFDALGKSTLLVRPPPRAPREDGELLVWWKGHAHNGDLMLLLAHMLVLSDDWQGRRITLASVVPSEAEAAALRARVTQSLAGSNIDASIDVLTSTPERTPAQLIQDRSTQADLVFLGLGLPDEAQAPAQAAAIAAQIADMSGVILVRNAGPFRGRLL